MASGSAVTLVTPRVRLRPHRTRHPAHPRRPLPNLLAEAGLYRYGSKTECETEVPVDEHNHALAALRYLISRLDARRMAKMAKRMPAGDGVGDDDGQADATVGDGQGRVTKRRERTWREMVEDDSLWMLLE